MEALAFDMGHSIAMTDAELLEASKRGERAAFGALVERYQGVVCAVSYSRTRDQALSEDVAQETFIAAWRQLDQLREPGRLRSWLCGIAHNLARKARRRSDRELPLEEQPLIVEGDNPFDAAARQEAERVVVDALSRVPEKYRDVLVLYYREQRSARDVADMLGISEAAAMQRLTRGREYLARGVTALVETSLRGQRTRRDLAACVVAALPMVVPSPVEASPSSFGGNMIKLAIAAVALGAAGTTAYVVHQTRSEPAPAPIAASTAVTPVASAPRTITPVLPPPPAAKPTAAVAPTPALVAPMPTLEPDLPPIDRAMSQRLGLDRGPARGPADAPVTIVVFNDMGCQFCGKALGAIDQLFEEYPNKLRLVIKQFPVKPTSGLAAEAAYAAEAQGKFFELYDLMLANQDDLHREGLIALAGQVGIDTAQFAQALDQHTYAGAVEADKAAGLELEFRGTPSFVINGRRVIGIRPIAHLRAMIDAALAD